MEGAHTCPLTFMYRNRNLCIIFSQGHPQKVMPWSVYLFLIGVSRLYHKVHDSNRIDLIFINMCICQLVFENKSHIYKILHFSLAVSVFVSPVTSRGKYHCVSTNLHFLSILIFFSLTKKRKLVICLNKQIIIIIIINMK